MKQISLKALFVLFLIHFCFSTHLQAQDEGDHTLKIWANVHVFDLCDGEPGQKEDEIKFIVQASIDNQALWDGQPHLIPNADFDNGNGYYSWETGPQPAQTFIEGLILKKNATLKVTVTAIEIDTNWKEWSFLANLVSGVVAKYSGKIGGAALKFLWGKLEEQDHIRVVGSFEVEIDNSNGTLNVRPIDRHGHTELKDWRAERGFLHYDMKGCHGVYGFDLHID